MIAAEAAKTGQRMGSAVAGALAALAIMLLAASPQALAAGKTATAAAPASVPVPRLAPKPAANAVPAATADPTGTIASDDAIAAIIADTPDESRASEDSDAPQAVGTAEPDVSEPMPPVSAPAPAARSALNSAGLKLALKFLDNGDPAAATVAAYALPDPTDIKIVDWLVATSGSDAVPASRILAAAQKLRDWPGQALLRLRYEQAVARADLAPADVIKALGSTAPSSDSATVALAEAYVASGRQKDAATLVRTFWRNESLSLANEKKVLAEFGDLITAADHKARMDRLLYNQHADEAVRTAALLGKDQIALAKAVASTIKNRKTAYKELTALPPSVRGDPLALYSRIQVLRRGDKTDQAANLMLSAPRDAAKLVDPDAWWIERRLISRALIEDGQAKLAYRIVAAHTAESATYRAEAEFHAGWYALEFLHDPATAAKHFAEIEAISTMPLSLSRAEYWLGRAAAAAGDKAGAAGHFKRAGAYPTTFYGQLALARLGNTRLQLSQPPAPGPDVRERFANRELVRVIQHLSAAGRDSSVGLFYRHLADTLQDPAEIALLAAMAEKDGQYQAALQVGKAAAVRGLPVETLAFPTSAIPAGAKTPRVEKSVVYAIARQESAFNPGAISGAGARGLLQLMPATAKQVAKTLGMPYSKARLTSDPAYNATLGAAHLGDLVNDFGGSYVMTFAAYNAGASRVAQWVRQHGDPRDPRVDVVNWIEMIPFTETRNYVQRIMENLQVYRARLGEPSLVIEADLRRGRSAG
jgi:soluble lytic murein transglycosylase